MRYQRFGFLKQPWRFGDPGPIPVPPTYSITPNSNTITGNNTVVFTLTSSDNTLSNVNVNFTGESANVFTDSEVNNLVTMSSGTGTLTKRINGNNANAATFNAHMQLLPGNVTVASSGNVSISNFPWINATGGTKTTANGYVYHFMTNGEGTFNVTNVEGGNVPIVVFFTSGGATGGSIDSDLKAGMLWNGQTPHRGLLAGGGGGGQGFANVIMANSSFSITSVKGDGGNIFPYYTSGQITANALVRAQGANLSVTSSNTITYQNSSNFSNLSLVGGGIGATTGYIGAGSAGGGGAASSSGPSNLVATGGGGAFASDANNNAGNRLSLQWRGGNSNPGSAEQQGTLGFAWVNANAGVYPWVVASNTAGGDGGYNYVEGNVAVREAFNALNPGAPSKNNGFYLDHYVWNRLKRCYYKSTRYRCEY